MYLTAPGHLLFRIFLNDNMAPLKNSEGMDCWPLDDKDDLEAFRSSAETEDELLLSGARRELARLSLSPWLKIKPLLIFFGSLILYSTVLVATTARLLPRTAVQSSLSSNVYSDCKLISSLSQAH
jgi:hypothetical protein